MAIDVSLYQGFIDWKKARAGGALAYAGIKAAEGLYETDSAFHYNALSATRNHIVISPYFFGHPSESASLQARHFITVAREYLKPGFGRPWLDLEVSEAQSEAHLQAWAKEWFSIVDPIIRCKSILYSFSGFVEHFGVALIDHPLWIANFDGIPTAQVPVGAWNRKMVVGHQFSEHGHWPGIKGEVDQDYRYAALWRLKIPRLPLARKVLAW